MGYRLSNAVRDMTKDRTLSASYWHVLTIIASFASDEVGICTASLKRIAEGAGLSIKQARRLKQKAISIGHVQVVANLYGGRPGSTQHLLVKLHKQSTPPLQGSPTTPINGFDDSHRRPSTPPSNGSQNKIQTNIKNGESELFNKPLSLRGPSEKERAMFKEFSQQVSNKNISPLPVRSKTQHLHDQHHRIGEHEFAQNHKASWGVPE